MSTWIVALPADSLFIASQHPSICIYVPFRLKLHFFDRLHQPPFAVCICSRSWHLPRSRHLPRQTLGRSKANREHSQIPLMYQYPHWNGEQSCAVIWRMVVWADQPEWWKHKWHWAHGENGDDGYYWRWEYVDRKRFDTKTRVRG